MSERLVITINVDVIAPDRIEDQRAERSGRCAGDIRSEVSCGDVAARHEALVDLVGYAVKRC
jgi:hypothetical protein